MKPFLFAAVTIAVMSLSTNIMAQHGHSDIEFGYNDTGNPTAFIIEQDATTSEGFQFFEAEFEEFLGDFFADDPGFTTNDAEGLLINPGDQIWFRVLDASLNSAFGQGFLNYYDPNTDTLSAAGRLQITDNGGASTLDLVLNGATIESGDNPQLLGIGDVDGDIHDHLNFDLLDDGTAPLGAYGILVQMQSDFDPANGNFDLDSDPFWIIFNHGMDEEDFENFALPKFGVASAVPEPGSLLCLTGAAFALALRRRRKV